MNDNQRKLMAKLLEDAEALKDEGLPIDESVIAGLRKELVPERFKTSFHTAEGGTIRYVPVQSQANPTASYVVTTLDGLPIACTCPAWNFNREAVQCKHMSAHESIYRTWQVGDDPINLV